MAKQYSSPPEMVIDPTKRYQAILYCIRAHWSSVGRSAAFDGPPGIGLYPHMIANFS